MFRTSTLFVVAYISIITYAESAKSPILFIPGLTGSPLNATDSSNGPCDTNGESRNVWFNQTLFTFTPECYAIQLELNYSANYSDVPGITVTPANFGSVSAVEFYAAGFIEYFLERGYTRDVDIRTAPYDWRLAPGQLYERGYYNALQQLIQTMYEQNGNAKVTIVVHSMGGPVSLHFLNNIVSQEWKDTYVHSYIPLAGAFGGGNAILPFLLTGALGNDTFTLQIGAQRLRDLYRTFPSYYLLLPRASVWNNTILIFTPTQNYTANDYNQLFIDIGYPQGYTQLTEINIEQSAPNVPTYCFYGLGVDTPLAFVYGDGFSDHLTDIVSDDGDNTVSRRSLEVCLQWADSNSGYSFSNRVFPGIDHSAILTDDSVLRAIGSVVGAPVDPINGATPLSTMNALHYCAVMILFAIANCYLVY